MEHKSMYSVIIPIYNSEKVIERCVNSVLNQTYKNLELILVNDGSTDTSGTVCDTIARSDERVKVVHKENGGVSSARNAGLDIAIGQYIVFVDSDDIVDVDLLYKFETKSSDLVMVGFDDYGLDEQPLRILVENDEENVLNNDKEIVHFLQRSSVMFVWGKCFRRNIIEDNNMRFDISQKINEDIIFNCEYILKANNTSNICWVGYHHCQYDTPTLSSTAENMPLAKRLRWREIVFKQFEGHPFVQEFYAKQLLYFVEQEFSKIANSNSSLKERMKLIAELLQHKIIVYCVEKYPSLLPKDIRFCCRYNIYMYILLKYGRTRG